MIKKETKVETPATKLPNVTLQPTVVKPKVEITPVNLVTKETPVKVAGTDDSIQIIWEESFLKDSMKGTGFEKNYDDVKMLIRRSDAFLRTFIRSKLAEKRTIAVPSGFGCVASNAESDYRLDSSKFKTEKQYKGDLVIFMVAYASTSSEAIAAAMPCRHDPDDNSTQIGVLMLNLARLFNPEKKNNYRSIANNIATIAHEVLHVIAFHRKVISNFQSKDLNSFPYLKRFKDITFNPMIGDSAHWSSRYLMNDMMNPISFEDIIFTIFSLEYIELANTQRYITNRESLGPNPLLDSISDFKDFLNYRCEDDKPSRYLNYCSRKDFNTNRNSFMCSADHREIQSCRKVYDPNHDNNCIERHLHSIGSCTDSVRPNNAFDVSVYGPNSRCMIAEDFGAICVKFEIRDNKIFFEDKQSWKECTPGKEAEYVTAVKSNSYSYTYVTCPELSRLKKGFEYPVCPDNCNFNGTCDRGKCKCFKGYSEADNCKYITHNAALVYFTQQYFPGM